MILLTGFEPFDGASVNPSWEAVCRVPDQIAGRDVHRLRLPVVYGEAAGLLRGASSMRITASRENMAPGSIETAFG